MIGPFKKAGYTPWVLLALSAVILGCGPSQPDGSPTKSADQAASNAPIIHTNFSATNSAQQTVPMDSYEVINSWPHDRNAFTQGLVFLDGQLLESTGLLGQSSLRRVELETGKVLEKISLRSDYFGEGLAVVGSKLFQLTWQNNVCLVYDLKTFRQEKQFTYQSEGWGLTTDGQWLIMSDGTDRLRFLDPDSFEVKRTVNVTTAGHPLTHLNELEYIKGEIFANIYTTDFIARIDPVTGQVRSAISLAGLLKASERDNFTDVLNGIAYDSGTDRIFVTGKRWPKLFELRLKKN